MRRELGQAYRSGEVDKAEAPARQKHAAIRVRRAPGRSNQAIVQVGGRCIRAALGRGGISAFKREGDGGTPIGRFPIRMVLYRPDRVARPQTDLPVRAIRSADGWSDDPADANYNRLIRLPAKGSAERLTRDDHLYDVVLVLGHNDGPRVRGRGSAIFLHLAKPGYSTTEGCVAVSRADMDALLRAARPGATVEITA
jgi:L,D-peptidoglycan transpeptidase YkuD (ErfK/YbiS/YcfS/YnhG family)